MFAGSAKTNHFSFNIFVRHLKIKHFELPPCLQNCTYENKSDSDAHLMFCISRWLLLVSVILQISNLEVILYSGHFFYTPCIKGCIKRVGNFSPWYCKTSENKRCFSILTVSVSFLLCLMLFHLFYIFCNYRELKRN